MLSISPKALFPLLGLRQMQYKVCSMDNDSIPMKIKLFIFAFFYVFLTTNSLAGTEIGDLVIVTKDSVPLRTETNNQAKIAKYADVSLQLKILDISDDKKWYKVKIGEQKGYQMSHIEKYWGFHEDVYQESENPNFEIQLDISVLENKKLKNAKRISHEDYLGRLKSLVLDSAYYVGSTYLNSSPDMSCSPPFSICAQIYKPGYYFLDITHTDSSNSEELESRYKQLYENGITTPFYEIKSNLKIETINEKFICSKVIMAKPGCYAEDYIGTETDILNNEVYTIKDYHFLSSFPINSEYLFQQS